jgi:hypothetical protein
MQKIKNECNASSNVCKPPLTFIKKASDLKSKKLKKSLSLYLCIART